MRISILILAILFFECTYDPEKREARDGFRNVSLIIFVTEILPNMIDNCPKPDLILEKGKSYSVTLVAGQRFWFDYATRINADPYDYQDYNLTLTKDSGAVIKLNVLGCNFPLTSSIDVNPKLSSSNQIQYQRRISGGMGNTRDGYFFTINSGPGNITLLYE